MATPSSRARSLSVHFPCIITLLSVVAGDHLALSLHPGLRVFVCVSPLPPLGSTFEPSQPKYICLRLFVSDPVFLFALTNPFLGGVG